VCTGRVVGRASRVLATPPPQNVKQERRSPAATLSATIGTRRAADTVPLENFACAEGIHRANSLPELRPFSHNLITALWNASFVNPSSKDVRPTPPIHGATSGPIGPSANVAYSNMTRTIPC